MSAITSTLYQSEETRLGKRNADDGFNVLTRRCRECYHFDEAAAHFALTAASPKLLLRQLLDVRLYDVRFESWFRKGGLFSKTAKLRSVTWIIAVVVSVRGEQDGRSAGELCVKR